MAPRSSIMAMASNNIFRPTGNLFPSREAAAMEKFTQWSSEHDAHVAKRQGADKKARQDKRYVPVVKKVEEVATPVATAPVEEAPAVEATPAVEETPVAEAPATDETKTAE